MNERQSNPSGPANAAGRFLTGVFGLVFGGVGVTVIAFLWGSPWNEFGSPPLIFRVVGSFIALAFVAFGGTAVFGAFSAAEVFSGPRSLQNDANQSQGGEDGSALGLSYTCPHCSAPLSNKADVSPHGDVKCSFCNCWFNTHGR